MADAYGAWKTEERQAVVAAAPVYLKVPIALAMSVGLCAGDMLKMTWGRHNRRDISTTTKKAGTFVWWRSPAALQPILNEAPRGKPGEIPAAAA